MLQELDRIDPCRDRDEALLDAHEEIVDLGGFGFGLRAGNFPDREGMLLAVESEQDPEASLALFGCGHAV